MVKKLKIFLTGGNGFIGKNILEQLGGKYDFIAPRSVDLDLTDTDKVSDFLKNIRPDLVIHAANLGGKRKDVETEKIFVLNLRMFFNIVHNRKYFGRMIMLGSGAEYDKRFDIADVKESNFDERVPTDQYGFYKYICAKYVEQSDFITHLRIFGMYGKHEDYSVRFISNNICRALLNLPISINQNAFFEMVLVDDFVKILNYFINYPGKEKLYNIGNNQRISLLDIGKKILEKSGKDLPILLKKEGFNKEYTCNNERLIKEISNFKFTSVEKSLDELFAYYSKKIVDFKKEDILFD